MAREKPPLTATQIDTLYGLEPVFEPAHGVHLVDWLELECAFCGERFGASVDLSAGSRSYIEDCQVCCQPLLVNIECGAGGQLRRAWAERGD
jgi:hypothetical protein